MRTKNPPAEPLFLRTDHGERFCLYYPPSSNKTLQGMFIYIHPFAEEMNKSRRMIALQARAFASKGVGVFQIDLFGCGDSQGNFKDASWQIWKQDISAAKYWIESHVDVPIYLWGLRLGALLALDFAKESEYVFNKIILWQPIINGHTFLTQFLRLKLASQMISRASDTTTNIQTMRNIFLSGTSLEIAGYELSSELACKIDNLRLRELMITQSHIHWFAITSGAGQTLSPAEMSVENLWKQSGINLDIHLISCQPFWATQEITECHELISATSKLVAD